MKTIYLLTLSLFTILSCKDYNLENSVIIPENMLYFENEESFLKCKKSYLEKNEEEQIAWEDSMNFNPFSREAEEIMQGIISCLPSTGDENAFFEELKQKLEGKGDFIILENQDGDKNLEYKVKSNALLNRQRMYQIGNNVYKVLNDRETVYTDKKNQSLLLMPDEKILGNTLIHRVTNEYDTKNAGNCPAYYEATEKSGRYKTFYSLSLNDTYFHYLITNLKKVVFVWVPTNARNSMRFTVPGSRNVIERERDGQSLDSFGTYPDDVHPSAFVCRLKGRVYTKAFTCGY